MQQTCRQCSTSFEITSDDLAFLEKVLPVFNGKPALIAPPSSCPLCRCRMRMAWRNERTLYRRNCALCEKSMITIFHPDEPYIVICTSCFWSDQWDPLTYGQTYDFSRPFTDQFVELLHRVPLIGLINLNTEKSEYCHRIFSGRNNYLSFIAIFEPENLYYTYYTISCKDCVDVTNCQYCERCYELTDSERCYQCAFGNRIKNCRDSMFLEDCVGCSHCYRCKNLHQKSYCIENKQYSKEAYEAEIHTKHLDSIAALAQQQKMAQNFHLTLPHRAAVRINCEYATGANIYNCRESTNIFDFYESERMVHCAQGEVSHDCMDCFGFGKGEFCYESTSFMGGQLLRFCIDCTTGSDMLYSYSCFQNSEHCFGCVSLKRGSYCILNTQYTQEEYESLVPKIIAHMRYIGEWGSFFPPSLSPYGYNETEGATFSAVSEEQAARLGLRWRIPNTQHRIQQIASIPDRITDVVDTIVDTILHCAACGKQFKIILQELNFLRDLKVALPTCCPDCRHRTRMASRAPFQLWKRNCQKCSKEMDASYAPERPEIVYCENCYLASVY